MVLPAALVQNTDRIVSNLFAAYLACDWMFLPRDRLGERIGVRWPRCGKPSDH
jgi:hypothetical protein